MESAVQRWEYKVAYVDYRGRISVEGEEIAIGAERRTAFLRRFLNAAGADGWELAGIQPLSPQSAYYVLKRLAVAQAPADTPAAQEP
jgi:hypothetical protein